MRSPKFCRRCPRVLDWVLIDSPPVTPLVDALALSRHSDASLLVVRADVTPAEAVEEALTLLGPKQALGIVLNGVEDLHKIYGKYYGYYRKRVRFVLAKMTAPAVQRISGRLRIFFAHSSRTAMYWPTSVWRLLTLAWAAEIFWMSTGTFAPGFSRSVEWSFLRLLHVHLPTETFLILHAISRKLAHLGEYGLLSFLVYRSLGGQIRVYWQPRAGLLVGGHGIRLLVDRRIPPVVCWWAGSLAVRLWY